MYVIPFYHLQCWSEMEARLAGPCPPPNSEREKKFQEGNECVSSLCMLVCKVWIKMIMIELQLHSELGMSDTMFLLFASAKIYRCKASYCSIPFLHSFAC